MSKVIPTVRLAGISGHTGFLKLKSGRTGPDNVPDFWENPDLSVFMIFLRVFESKIPLKTLTPSVFYKSKDKVLC